MEEAAERDRPGFFRVGSDVVKKGVLEAMTSADVKVYLVLALHANWRTGKCWPTVRTIRALSVCSLSSVISAIGRLSSLGAISYRKIKSRSGVRNEYTVFRSLQLPSGGCSSRTEDPPKKQARDDSGRFFRGGCSSRTEDPCSSATEDPCSTATEQNEIYLNEIERRTRSKEDAPPAPSRGSGHASEASARPMPPSPLSISEATIKTTLRAQGKAGA